jgi:prophage regulatory protein
MIFDCAIQTDSYLCLASKVIGRRSSGKHPKKVLPKFQDYASSISNDMPEAGGGGASAVGATTDSPSATGNDDDGDDGDGDPDPERRKRHPSPSGQHRNVTATADALLWSLPTLCQRIGLCRSNIYQQIQGGKFPEPVKIGRSSRWLAAEIEAWVNTQAEARSPKTAG